MTNDSHYRDCSDCAGFAFSDGVSMFTASKVYKCCVYCGDRRWRVISEGNAKDMRSAARKGNRADTGHRYCVTLSMCAGIGDYVNLPAPRD